MLNLFKRRKDKLPGNPRYKGIAPGVGRTVKPQYNFQFKTLELYRTYWAMQINETSKNIHTKRPWEI